MDTRTPFSRSGRFLLPFFAAALLPISVAAQPTLVVTPATPINLQTNAGTNAPSQTLQISNSGNRALKWTVQDNASWLSVSPATGVNSGTVTLTFQTSGLAVGQYPATVSVTSNGGSTNIAVQVTINPGAPPATLTVTCPSNITANSSNGLPVAVNYTVTTSGGVQPVTVTGTPASGSLFPVGTTTVQVNAKSNDGQTASCSFTVTVNNTTPPSSNDITVNPSSAPTGTAVTASYSVTNPTSGDWISMSPAGSSLQTYTEWKYAGSCSQTQGAARASGSCSFTAPVPAGSYELRLFANNLYTLLDTVAFTSTSSAPPPLTLTCPANMTVTSPNGSPVVVNYTPTTSGGIPPVTVTGTPASGTSFPIGTTTVQVSAQSSDGQAAGCSFTVTVNYTPSSGLGPQPTITCPAGSVNIFPGTSIQGVVDINPGGTTFCLKAGVHTVNSHMTPKTGDTFIGEYGAIIDGTGWTTTDDTLAAFRAHNQDIDFVTIRNLTIRNLRRAIHALGAADHWTIENNEIGPNYSAIVFAADSSVRNNYIHDNSYSGYMGVSANNSVIESNEFARNGWEQKIALSANVVFRNNFFHHNAGAGIWYDSDNTSGLVENNRVEDNGWIGVFYEISGGGIIRNNTIRRNGEAGVFLGTSKNTEIHHNILDSNFRGITYFLNCEAVGGGSISYDLVNNASHDNTIIVGTQSGAFATVFSVYGACTATQIAPYVNGLRNLTFTHNAYDVPLPTTGQYWFWNALKFWNEWQALGHDTTGSVQ